MWLMEQPLIIVGVGSMLVAVLVGGLLQTGKHILLYAAVGVVLLTIGLLGLERSVLTPREAVKATLHVIAHDLEQNDVEAILTHISEHRAELRKQAKREMERWEIVKVDIKRNLKVEVVSERGMDVAEAKFNCIVEVKARRGITAGGEFRSPLFFQVQFKKENDQWRIRSYEMSDPREGIGLSSGG